MYENGWIGSTRTGEYERVRYTSVNEHEKHYKVRGVFGAFQC